MENSTEKELLIAIAEGQRKSLRTARIISIACIAIAALMVLLALLVLPKAMAAMDRLDGALKRLDDAMVTLDGLSSSFSNMKDEFSGFLHDLLQVFNIVIHITSFKGMIGVENDMTGNILLFA